MKKIIKENKTHLALVLLWSHISKKRKKQFFLLIILMLATSVLEVVSLGAVLPFLAALTAPEELFGHPLAIPVIQLFGFTEPNQIIFPLTLFFVMAALLAGAVRLFQLYVVTRLTLSLGADLSVDAYRRTLYQNYSVHVSRNSSEVINGIISKTRTVIGGVVSPLLDLISSAILLVAIMSLLLAINTTITLSSFIGFGLIYLLIIRFTRKHLQHNSKVVAEQSTEVIKTLQEGLGGIRDVLLDGTQDFYCKLFRNADIPVRRATGSNTFIGGGPRFVIEAAGMTLIAVLAYLMFQFSEGSIPVIPVLGVLAVGAQRLLPALQRTYGSYSSIKGSLSSLEDVNKLLEQPLPDDISKVSEAISFEKTISLKNISFRYSQDAPLVLNNVNITLKKGEHIGFIGTTGSGKSTLLDIIMGLLLQTEGNIFIDDQVINDKNRRSWQANIAHVPQNIFLSDNSIEENIAFGVSKAKINKSLVKKSAKQAQINELIESLKDGYQTIIGEHGVRLSGGQRQRIGIARALYKQANVLIFDEATSALDHQTEKMVMSTINELDKNLTVLIIAHRLSTLEQCNQIIDLSEAGQLGIKNIIKGNW